MNDQRRHIVVFLIIAFFTVGLIAGVNVWFGNYLRNAKLANVYSIYHSVQYYETTMKNFGEFENEVIIPHAEHSEGWVKRPLEKPYIQKILAAADIALVVAGVFIFLIVLSLEKQSVRKTLWLFGLLCAFIAIAIIAINGLINHYSNKPRQETKYYDSIEKVPIFILDDDKLCESGVLQNFRISGDMRT